MLGMFAAVFWLAKFPMQWISGGVDALKLGVAPLLDGMPMLQSLVTDGMIGGVGASSPSCRRFSSFSYSSVF